MEAAHRRARNDGFFLCRRERQERLRSLIACPTGSRQPEAGEKRASRCPSHGHNDKTRLPWDGHKESHTQRRRVGHPALVIWENGVPGVASASACLCYAEP